MGMEGGMDGRTEKQKLSTFEKAWDNKDINENEGRKYCRMLNIDFDLYKAINGLENHFCLFESVYCTDQRAQLSVLL